MTIILLMVFLLSIKQVSKYNYVNFYSVVTLKSLTCFM